jgi:hypothetical protein
MKSMQANAQQMKPEYMTVTLHLVGDGAKSDTGQMIVVDKEEYFLGC